MDNSPYALHNKSVFFRPGNRLFPLLTLLCTFFSAPVITHAIEPLDDERAESYVEVMREALFMGEKDVHWASLVSPLPLKNTFNQESVAQALELTAGEEVDILPEKVIEAIFNFHIFSNPHEDPAAARAYFKLRTLLLADFDSIQAINVKIKNIGKTSQYSTQYSTITMIFGISDTGHLVGLRTL